MPDILIAKRLIDYVGLNVKDVPERYFTLFKDINPVLALLQGMGADGAQLVNVDSAGNLRVTLAGGTSGVIGPLQLAAAVGQQLSSVNGQGDNNGGTTTAAMAGYLFDGALWSRPRAASAANQAAQSGPGIQMAAPPGNWSVSSAPALGAQATATRAAGGAGVRHICTGYEVIISSQAAPLAGQLLVNLRDGISGAGAILKQWAFEIPAALYGPIVIAMPGRSIVGSAATAMTLESSAAYAAVGVSVTIDGFDAS